MAERYKCLPSEILGIKDDYTAYCFNEACCQLMIRLDNEEKPEYIEEREQKEKKEKAEPKAYSSFADYYRQFGGK